MPPKMRAPKPTKLCRMCATEMPIGALKCAECGAFQNYRRFLDFGNNAIALLVALISVSTLAVDTGVRALRALYENPLAPQLVARVLHADVNAVRILLINNGTSRVYVSDGALCRVPTVKPGVTLATDDGGLIRYPSGHEVAAVYAISYGSKGNALGQFVGPGATAISEAPRGTTLVEDGKPFDTSVATLKGYCSLSYLGMDGNDDGAFVDLSALDTAALGDAMAKLPRSELFNARIEYDQPSYPTPEPTTVK